jgi:hypothetical protein
MEFPRLAQVLNSIAGKLIMPKSAIPKIPLPYSQARQNVNRYPQMPHPTVFQSMNLILSQLTPQERQQLMLALYHGNFLNHDVVGKTVNPICSFPGFNLKSSADTPTIQQLLDEFLEYNNLNIHQTQRILTNTYVIMGELLGLAGQSGDVSFVQFVSPLIIHQIIGDPDNPYEPMCIVLEPSLTEDAILYNVIVKDERRFSAKAQAIRANIAQECYYKANFEDLEFEDAYTSFLPLALFPDAQQYDSWTRRQRRGKPWLMTVSDLTDHLTTTLWGMLDKMRDGVRFNYDFKVDTGEDDPQKSYAIVNAVASKIGIPEQGMPFYHDERTTMTPVRMTLAQGDISGIMDTVFKLSGMGTGIAPYDMGANNVNFATTKSQGTTSEQSQASIQADMEDLYELMGIHTLQVLEARGAIPRAELQCLTEAKTRKHYGVKATSPELATKNLQAMAQTFNVNTTSLIAMKQAGLWHPDMIAKAGEQLSTEILGVTINALSEEEKESLKRKAQEEQLAQPPQPPTSEPKQAQVEAKKTAIDAQKIEEKPTL